MRGFKGECAHFSCNKCPIYTLDGASAKFSTNSQETDNSVVWLMNYSAYFQLYSSRGSYPCDELFRLFPALVMEVAFAKNYSAYFQL